MAFASRVPAIGGTSFRLPSSGHVPVYAKPQLMSSLPRTATRSQRRRTRPAATADGFYLPDEDDYSPSTSSPGASGTQYKALASLVERLPSIDDTNALQTALANALVVEEYAFASAIRDRLKEVTGSTDARIDWASLGLPEWLSSRVERLSFRFPTEVQRRAAPAVLSGLDTIIKAETGSGKTLSYLAPALANLQYPPEVYPGDLQGPQLVILVPHMELGVQTALLIFKMYGGNISLGRPGDPANMYTYFGPKGIKVRGVLNKEEVAMAKGTDYLRGVHVVVATPTALLDCVAGKDKMPLLDHIRVIAVDEYDECFDNAPEAMFVLLALAMKNKPEKPQMVAVGATVDTSMAETAVLAGWMKEPVIIQVGKDLALPSGLKHQYIVVEPGRKLAVLTRMLRQDLELLGDDSVPARAMIFANNAEEAGHAVEPLRSALWSDHKLSVLLPPGTRIAPPPGMVQDPEEAEALGLLDQDGDEAQINTVHELAGASPFSASDPIRAMLSFRDNKTSLLLCTPQASRGLDLPAVSHVYNLGLPEDAKQYLHRAGRAGRVGSTSGGIITTLVTPDELEFIKDVGKQLGITMEEGQQPGSQLPTGDVEITNAELEKVRRGLDDLYNLM